MNDNKKTIIIAFLLVAITFAVLIIIFSPSETYNLNSCYLVPEQKAYMQASAVSKLVPVYGGKYYNDAEFWSGSTVDEIPLKIYDTNGLLYQYLFTVSNQTRKLGVIAIAANKSLEIPVMAIDDGSNYYLHYYGYNPEESREELQEYIDSNYPDTRNPEIKNYIHDLFTVSSGFRLDDKKSGDSLIINRKGHIYNLSLTIWNKTTPVIKNYDSRCISERVSEWEESNELFNETYNEMNLKGINLFGPLSEEETKYFSEFARENEGLYNASNGCRPFSLPPVYPEDEPVSRLFHEYGFAGISNYRCLNLYFNHEITDEEIKAEITGTVNESRIISLQIFNPETVERIYVELPIHDFNDIRTDLILYSRPMEYYRVSDDNITIIFSGKTEDISPLISEKYNLTDAKVAEIWFEDGTGESYVEEQRKKFDSNEKVIVAGYA